MQGTTMALPDYSVYSTPKLLEAYTQGPARLRSVIAGMTEDQLHARPRGADKWSAHEIVFHVYDSEIQGVYRIRKAWSEVGVQLPGYDQDLWTRKLNHQAASAEERELTLELFSLLRKSTVHIFRRATANDWNDRWGTHPEFGRLSLRQLLELYADHSERHIEHILTTRKLLGIPLDMKMVLERRLL